MTNDEILNIKLSVNRITVRQLCTQIAAEAFVASDSFRVQDVISGSEWRTEIYIALVKVGAVQGVIDEYGDLCECDYDEADELVAKAIESMATEVKPEQKRKMVAFWGCCGDAVAVDPSRVVGVEATSEGTIILLSGSESKEVKLNFVETLKALGIELVESKGTVK